MKRIIGIIFVFLGVFSGLYVGGWLMFVKPIIDAYVAFDNGTLTGLIVGTTVLKCLFASLVGCVLYCIGFVIGKTLIIGK